MNLEKWAIWQPAKSKTKPQVRILKRELTLPNGDRITAQVEVAPTSRGSLTTEDQKTYYALIEHWEANGKLESVTPLSLSKLAKRLNKKWGTNVIESLTDSLVRLRATTFVWENSYFDNASQETIDLLDTFNILTELKIIKRKKDGTVNREVGYYRFNDSLLKNLQTNHTKPVLFNVVLGFKSEIAQLLYTHIDLILAGNPIYERRTKELFDDLGISGKTYAYASKRKQVLDPAITELSGVPLSKGGIIASATIERTKDKKDYKLVFRKGVPPKAQASAADAPAAQGEEEEATEQAYAPPQKQSTNTEQKGEELLRHFHRVFFGIEATATRARHRDLADALIAQHGWDVAVHVVNFAHVSAQETKFKIQTFGGITQYVDRAVADYYERKRAQERRQQEESAAAEQRRSKRTAEAARRHAQERYNQLPESERQALIATYTAKLLAENPIWQEREGQGVSLLNTAVRAAIIEDFTRQELGD